jgi:hypothetical protein
VRQVAALVGQASACQRPGYHRVPLMWGRLVTCAAVDYRRRSAARAAVGRLTIGRSLPSCPTTSLALALGAGRA